MPHTIDQLANERPLIDQLMTVNQVAQLFCMSKEGIYKLCRQQRLPCTRVGKRIRFSKKAINQYLAGRTTGVTMIKAKEEA